MNKFYIIFYFILNSLAWGQTQVIPSLEASASNLTTVGAVPYVSASGVLNQDASNFFWDATNHRLGIGTNAPKSPLHVATGPIVVEGTGNPASTSGLELHTSGGISYVTAATRNSGGSITAYLPTVHEGSYIAYKNSGTEYGRLTGGKWGLGAGNTSPTGTLHVYDATASTGATTLTAQAGDANTISIAIIAVKNKAGSNRLTIGVDNNGSQLTTYDSSNSPRLKLDTNFYAGSTNAYYWTSGDTNSAADTSLSRISAGIVGVGTGAAGSTAGIIQAAALLTNAVAFASRPGTPTEGMIVAFTDSSTAVWGATITGSGANHVLGYYNGTNWTVIGK